MHHHGNRLVRLLRAHDLDHLRRRVEGRASPAWSNLTEHDPVPLVIVNVDPEFEQAPELEKTTTPPGADAATEKLEPKTADAGACVETVIVWFAFGVTGVRVRRLRSRTDAVRLPRRLNV